MPTLRLPDGQSRSFDQPLSALEAAQSLSPSLARRAVAARIDGRLRDLSARIENDADFALLSAEDAEGLEVVRHSTAHLLAYAVKQLFPEAQVTIGPVIEDGFYYDFAFARAFTPDDLAAIEARMKELAARNEPVTRTQMPRDEAIAYFRNLGEHYKAELIAAIPEGEVISLYAHGGFTDLCRGPHVPSTGHLKHFKLTKLAGAYWRGDAKNAQLQRIYGTAWASREALAAYLHRIEEAERRDHRRLGRELDLFHIEELTPGAVFWHPKGWALWQQLEHYLRRVYRENGYQEVRAPQLLDRTLWEKTGHWDKFGQHNMFVTESEKRVFAVKPMNCPGHILIYKQGIKSWRDLPLRLGEFGSCHRNEASGALHGLMRVRAFTQDDGHIFCTEEQIQSECAAFTALLQKVYADFGFSDILYKISTRPAERIGSDEIWDKAEGALMQSLKACNCAYTIQKGEGAFYGPKIEYTLKDALGRQWQCGTIQVDFSMPARLGAEYVAASGERKTPVMLHRAIVGSLERFIGVLIEHYAGALPLWLSPIQVVLLTITEAQADYAQSVAAQLRAAGMRVAVDDSANKITYKIREHALQKPNYLLVIGEKEKAQGTLAVRARGNQDLGALPIADFLQRAQAEIGARA